MQKGAIPVELNLDLKLSQTLSPQMVQAMQVLQMGAQELQDYIQEALLENPVLEAEEPADGEDPTLLLRKLDWLDRSTVQQYSYLPDDDEDDRDPVSQLGAAPEEEHLYFYVLSQLPPLRLAPELEGAVHRLVECLDGNGYLDEPLDALAQDLSIPLPLLEQALDILQGLEPAGVGARGLGECLCLQLARRQGDTALARAIATSHLPDLAKNHYGQLAKELSCSQEEVRHACDLIRSLNPKPGSGFAARTHLAYIHPDLFVVSFPDHFDLLPNDYFFPSLRLSGYYQSLLGESQDAEVTDYLRNKIRQAQWVVRSIHQRRDTLMICARHILETQEAFFRKGPGHLVPLSLAQVAAKMSVHESTVSRAVKDKYLQCSHGVYPLNYFFPRSLGGGEVASPDGAKAMLRKLIAEENRAKPLSDQKICALMEAAGCQLSRRTVAKYRDELGIPPATGRKELP